MTTEVKTAVPVEASNGTITEDEAALYDRQIRLWGVEAQNRMHKSTVLVLSLRSLAHETIKNLVLAGIGRLIVMDGGIVTEEDLGSGFLFQEEAGAVGKERTAAALPQIASLNSNVKLTAFPTLEPFVSVTPNQGNMVEFLQREKVDVVVACDLTRAQMEAIDAASRLAGSLFFGAGSYGFYGYVFADLGENYNYVFTPQASGAESAPPLVKKSASFATLSAAMDKSNWSLPATEIAKGGSPFRGISRMMTRERQPQLPISIMALWEYEGRKGSLPTGASGQMEELAAAAEELRVALGVTEKLVPKIDDAITSHLAEHATQFFPPTLAILGGLLAQDVLRAISRKDRPIVNLLVLDSMGGVGTVSRWAMADVVDETTTETASA